MMLSCSLFCCWGGVIRIRARVEPLHQTPSLARTCHQNRVRERVIRPPRRNITSFRISKVTCPLPLFNMKSTSTILEPECQDRVVREEKMRNTQLSHKVGMYGG